MYEYDFSYGSKMYRYVSISIQNINFLNDQFIWTHIFPSFPFYLWNYLNENYFLNHFVIFLHNDSKRLLIILEQLHLEAYIVNYILWLIWFGLCHAILSEDLTETFQIDVTYSIDRCTFQHNKNKTVKYT